jgi:outer membrane protein OmpA-like peptidoglycan-associated protein
VNKDGGAFPLFMTIHREQFLRAGVLRGMRRPKLSILLAGAALVACSSKSAKKPSVLPTVAATSPGGTATAQAAPPEATRNVGVSEDLAKRCSLRFANVEDAPKFGYNDDDLLPADRDVLQQVAECLVRGPLTGKAVQLVGRADPRGTEEYNLGLGTRRAESVRSYLLRLGVPGDRLAPTTRGELDAIGVNESSWERDRRVDLQLVN